MLDERDACGTGFVADVLGRSSRQIVDLAVEALCRVRHRGAVAADARTGDGAGLLLPIPRRWIADRLADAAGAAVAARHDPERLGLAGVFVSDDTPFGELRRIVEEACAEEALEVLAWRSVPTHAEALGDHALRTAPRILQAVLAWPTGRFEEVGERACHRARRRAEAAARREDRAVYFPSFSFLTVVYKALVAADQLAEFYPDLQDPLMEAPFAVFHQRYSTNTTPTWERAQPFRMLCHNGEINTLAGNVNRMRSREGRLGLPSQLEEDVLRPVIDESGSDSAMLDNVVEVLAREGGEAGSGRDVRQVMTMLVPPAWEGIPDLDPAARDFYRWHASQMEPWDGPAALIFTDGSGVGAVLDRNGLRPMRWMVAEDGLVVASSEAGTVDARGHGRVRRGKLGPGQMIFVDPSGGGLQLDPVSRVARHRPYGRWLEEHRVAVSPGVPAVPVPDDLERRQVAHGYTREELNLVVKPSAANGKEPTFSMGDDTPLPPFSRHGRPLYGFFKQRFAQVTNPPIDHLRERHVMSLRTLLGPRDPLLWERAEGAALLECETFLLFRPTGGVHLDATWPAEEGPAGLRPALEALAARAVDAAIHGSGIMLVSDEAAGPDRAPIPSLLAVGAVNSALLRTGHRTRTSLVVQTDDAREAHHVACLLGYGAEAVYPRLALATVAALAAAGRAGDVEGVEHALLNWRAAVEEGVLKILSKLGISCVDSYRGAQTFDALGLAPEVVDLCFEGTASPVGGLGFEDLGELVLARHRSAWGGDGNGAGPALPNPGFVKFHRGGEPHANEPNVVRALHETVDPGLSRLKSTQAGGDPLARGREEAAALGAAVREPGHPELYARFADLVNGRAPTTVRDLLEPVAAGEPVPVEDVEPAADILRRFSTGAISHGAISAEAHETLAMALNMVGGKSNTGEGGEDPGRFRTERNSRIKQVASGRFGVTPEYLAFAEELQIKMAQGSKPGEGGQLPGHKVTKEIARLRHTRPGVALISPAPHHDIYSIEDLSQLIFDLKQANPDADVSVKLVAEAGVGTIAAGVVKGLAEVVHVAGADGGTGASPLSSIKNAGLPWEVGLAESQQALVESGLRSRARIRIDGGLKTGRDVVVAALLGADEYSFGTAALLAEGCIMVRTCHLDTCPTGIATQRPDLRAKFAGTPEMVAAYLRAVAEEVRGLLASLGLRSLDEAIGRTDLLRQREDEGPAGRVDLSSLLVRPVGQRRFVATVPFQRQRGELGDRLYEEAWPAVRDGGTIRLGYEIGNGDRTVGARLGAAIGREFGEGEPGGRAHVTFRGSAGQSFGAFLAAGVELRLAGEANDYVGKGMGGGRIVIVPPEGDAGDPWLVGNTVLYGATGGELFVAGRAGERFAVRNSGATTVVEGAGDHCCEYMTGGTVVVLGPVGLNMGAG
ncbi:MAG: glutamate synthase subunit alpha, partial [Actinobacteria bacterium]|nr:glutamate synthase subunit alpha [Actinomycetota bacterium]